MFPLPAFQKFQYDRPSFHIPADRTAHCIGSKEHLRVMLTRSRQIFGSFTNDRQGTIAIIFGLMFLAVTMVVGMAIDLGRVLHARTRLIVAADAAALAAGGALLNGNRSDVEIETLAKNFFAENIEQSGEMYGTVAEPSVTVNRAWGQISIEANAVVPMTLTKIAGFTDVNLPVNSITRFDQRDVELGMALDVTGSMYGTKLSELKVAAKDLVDMLLPDGSRQNKVRIGLAPYAASVNAGSYASPVTGGSNVGNTCVFERSGANRFTDALPIGADVLGTQYRTRCPGPAVVPLTDDKGLLKSQIDSYSARGATAGHIGTAWAWYLVSPVWASIWPSSSKPVAYGDSETIKAIILMTDGEFNTQYVSANGNSADQARAVCAEMKKQNVAVYSVAFQAPGSAQAVLQDCASGSDFYFNAENGDELRQSFQKIAQRLSNLRLMN